jgi:hypothetical protein
MDACFRADFPASPPTPTGRNRERRSRRVRLPVGFSDCQDFLPPASFPVSRTGVNGEGAAASFFLFLSAFGFFFSRLLLIWPFATVSSLLMWVNTYRVDLNDRRRLESEIRKRSRHTLTRTWNQRDSSKLIVSTRVLGLKLPGEVTAGARTLQIRRASFRLKAARNRQGPRQPVSVFSGRAT